MGVVFGGFRRILEVVRALLPLIVACSGAPVATTDPAKPDVAAKKKHHSVEEEIAYPVADPIGALAPVEDGQVSWLVPGRVQLERAGATIDAPGGNRPIEVVLLDRNGSAVRVGVRLEHARFALWSDASRLLGVLKTEQELTPMSAVRNGNVFVTLKPGARVRKLARKNAKTQIRYVGTVEVEGWVPDAALTDAGPSERNVRIPSARRSLMVIPGTVIRVEPKWAGTELATTATSSFLEIVKEIDEAWVDVSYNDREVSLRGFLSRRAPPGKVHRPKDPDVPPPTMTPNVKVASGVCLYAKRGGEPVGYIVGDRDVQLDNAGTGWWTLAIDSPWGAIAFIAKGPTQTTLAACAPAGSVPASTLTPISP